MTGEITLTGQVLPIGGIREKSLAAQRAGLKRVIFPRENESDLVDLPPETREALTFIPADTIEDVFAAAFDGDRRAPLAARAARGRAAGGSQRAARRFGLIGPDRRSSRLQRSQRCFGRRATYRSSIDTVPLQSWHRPVTGSAGIVGSRGWWLAPPSSGGGAPRAAKIAAAESHAETCRTQAAEPRSAKLASSPLAGRVVPVREPAAEELVLLAARAGRT